MVYYTGSSGYIVLLSRDSLNKRYKCNVLGQAEHLQYAFTLLLCFSLPMLAGEQYSDRRDAFACQIVFSIL
jgi:hypothetical protein